ncbi:MAG: winged helix-turn-helix transcriptional regulator [Roseibium sp.]
MEIASLVNLTSKAWSLKILALMHSGVPGRQAPLLSAAQANRASFAASLQHLIQLGLLEKNPGHGHPLRPEFRLTPTGKQAAEMASRIVQHASGEQALATIRRSWTVPILAVTQSPIRFSNIKSGLGPITDRALSKSLGVLEEQDWLKRDIDISQRSPFPTYQAVNAGKEINRAIAMMR